MTDYYGDDFWAKYEDYVQESLPRHNRAWQSLTSGTIQAHSTNLPVLLDLGCGHSMEAQRLFSYSKYIGVDLALPDHAVKSPHVQTHEMDYRSGIFPDFGAEPTAFCSLFSSEITRPFTENYALYEHLFSTFKSIQYGVVSGFYYKSKKHQLVVQEAGGVRSYQSIEASEIVRSSVFNERRYYVDAPSTLFGDDVVEVWKLLVRSSS